MVASEGEAPLSRRLNPILAGAAFLAMPLAVLAPKQLAALVTIVAVACVVFGWRALREQAHVPRALLLPLAGLIVWMGASALWTIDLSFTLMETLRFALMTLGGLILVAAARALDDRGRQAVSASFLAGFVAGLTLLAFEIATEGLLLRSIWWLIDIDKRFIFSVAYNRATSVIGVLMWPAALFFLQRRAPVVAIVALVAGMAMTYELQKWASLIALYCGVAAFALAWLSARVTARVLAAAVAVLLLVAPIIPRTVLKPVAVARVYPDISFSEYHRLLIWDFAAKRIAERPLLGWGMNTSRVIPGGKETRVTAIPERGSRGSGDEPAELMPLHPHNTPLQLWLELGVPGVLLAGALVVGAFLLSTRQPGGRAGPAANIATLVGVIAISAMSFSMWQSWWLAVLWLAAMLLAAAAPREAKPPP